MWTILFEKTKKIVHIAFDVYALFIHFLKKIVNSRRGFFDFFAAKTSKKSRLVL